LQKPARYVAVNCEALLEQVKTDLAEPLQSSAATIEVGELPWVRGDADRLYQLFLNLVSNAIKFRRAEEPLVLSVLAESRGADAIICVKDNGIGVDPNYLNVIFDAFRRLHTQSAYEGSGLGLAICKQIVEEHGGRIWVRSEPGRGSQFFVALPLVAGATDAGS
jgi:signal transduction histidine kinase